MRALIEPSLGWGRRLTIVVVAVCLCAGATHNLLSEPAPKRVVALFPAHGLTGSSQSINQSIGDALNRSADRVDVSTEFLDLARFGGPAHEAGLVHMLRGKYPEPKVDALIVVTPEALGFVERYRHALFPGVPIVFAGIPSPGSMPLPPHATGILTSLEPLATLELAMALQPRAREVLVLSGAANSDQRYRDKARADFARYESRLEFQYLEGRPLAEVLQAVGRVRSDAIIVLLGMLLDGAGQSYRGNQLAVQISATAAAPVYGVDETYLGSGVVGGYMDTFQSMGEAAAVLTLEVLRGQPAESIAPFEGATHRLVVDARALERWGLDPKRLPPGTEVRNAQPSLWDLHGQRISLGVAAFLLQSMLVVVLLLRNRKLRAERALRQSEERYRAVVEAQTDLICRYLSDTTLTFVNEAYCKYFGRTRDELIGRKFIELVPPSDREDALQHVRSLVAGACAGSWTHEVLKPDGTIGHQHWIDQPIVDARGRTVEIQGIGRDVTQLRRAEFELERQREQVTHLTRVAILGQLAGALAHELRQPLTAILSNAQAAQRLLARERVDVEELNAILGDIVADDVRTGEVIVRLRSLLKKDEQTFELLDLNAVVGDTLALARGKLLEHRVAVVAKLTSPLPPARGDSVQLQQVLLNLLLNAVEAMSAVEPSERKLVVSTAQQGEGFLVAAVADSGEGISPQTAARLFEPFYTTKPQGLGLGLSISQSIIAVHGGKLTASNNAHRGATFVFTLPIHVPPPGSAR